MDLALKDRVAIVGGSSRGIGRAIAQAFAREGASVTICARNEGDLRRTEIELARISSQHHVLAIPADLSVPRDIRRVVRDTFNRFEQVGVLVTHMGTAPSGRPSEFSDETIMGTMQQIFLGAIQLSREVIPYMKQQRWGRIINLLPSGEKRLSYGRALASSSQMALVGYSKMLSNELAPFNITVNNVMSGPVETEYLTSTMESRAKEEGRSAEDVRKEMVADIPMRRLGSPQEIADLIVFLSSDRAGYVTGTSMVVDGGMLQSIR